MLLDCNGYFAVTPSTGAAAAAVTGDTLTVKNAPLSSRSLIISLAAKNQTAGFHRLTWPSGNDQTRGYQYEIGSLGPWTGTPFGLKIPVRPQELITAFIAGSAAAGDVEAGLITIWYDDVPGVAARLISWADVLQRGTRSVTVDDTIGATTSSTWSGGRALNAGSDLLQANTDYAVLGIQTRSNVIAMSIRGPDTGNSRCAVPANATLPQQSNSWFKVLSDETGLPCIPVINSANKGATIIEALVDENVATPIFDVVLVELAP